MAFSFLLAMAFLTRGFQLFQSPSFQIWQAVAVAILVPGNIIMLKYLHYKRYSVAFKWLLISLTTFLGNYAVEIAGVSQSLISATVYLHFATAGAFYVSLIFSKAAERPHLKKAGIVGFLIACTLILTMVGGLFKVYAWVSILGGFIAIFYLQNFYHEVGYKKLSPI